jgi:hypothetical protein
MVNFSLKIKIIHHILIYKVNRMTLKAINIIILVIKLYFK